MSTNTFRGFSLHTSSKRVYEVKPVMKFENDSEERSIPPEKSDAVTFIQPM